MSASHRLPELTTTLPNGKRRAPQSERHASAGQEELLLFRCQSSVCCVGAFRRFWLLEITGRWERLSHRGASCLPSRAQPSRSARPSEEVWASAADSITNTCQRATARGACTHRRTTQLVPEWAVIPVGSSHTTPDWRPRAYLEKSLSSLQTNMPEETVLLSNAGAKDVSPDNQISPSHMIADAEVWGLSEGETVVSAGLFWDGRMGEIRLYLLASQQMLFLSGLRSRSTSNTKASKRRFSYHTGKHRGRQSHSQSGQSRPGQNTGK